MSDTPEPKGVRPTRPLPDHELLNRESWNIFQIMSEFVEGFEQLSTTLPSVSVFGSARTKPGDPNYVLAETIGRKLSDAGFTVVTGGGPGIMEAANKGAFAGESLSVGLNITLPMEQQANRYQDLSLHYRHFFSRKVMFVKYACAYVVLPGGFGTMDEMMEILTLVQTGKTRSIPIVLVDGEFWAGLLDWFRDHLMARGMIARSAMDLMTVADDPDEVVRVISEYYATHSPHPSAHEQEVMRGL